MKIILLAILFFVTLFADCQIPSMTRQKSVDSLFTLLPRAGGTKRVAILNQLALQLACRSFDSSFRYAAEALSLSDKLNYPYGKGIATFNIGNSFYYKADIKNALTNYLTALRILEPFEPTSDIGNLLIQLAAVNQYVRNTEKMTAYYKRAACNFAAIGDTQSEMILYFSLGSSYYYKLQTVQRIDSLPAETARSMMDSALKYHEIYFDYITHHHPDPDMMPDMFNQYGLYYLFKDYTRTKDYYLKALDATRSMMDTSSRIIMKGLMLANLGDYYYSYLNDLVTGYRYTLLGADLLKKTDRYDLYSMALLILGEIELKRRHFNSSTYLFHESLNNSDKFLSDINKISHQDPTFRIWGITQVRSFRIDLFSDLALLYETVGAYKKALEYHKKLEEEKSIQTLDELNREIIGLEVNYEDEKNRLHIALLTNENELSRLKLYHTRILFAGIGGLLLIALLIILLWIQRKRFHSDHKALVLEQKLLRAQMNPHFIFNSLYSIQNFIVTERPDKASIYLSKFARLVRNILDNSTVEYVTLDKEIGNIENYLELQQVRYAGKFDYNISVADEIDVEIMMIPPMLAQPFIENAIEHGIKHRETPGHIDIRFNLDNHTLLFEVEDNGVGRQKARELNKMQEPGHRSMATSLTHERLVNLNRKLNKKIFLDILDLKNARGEAVGTRVTFGIPIYNESRS